MHLEGTREEVKTLILLKQKKCLRLIHILQLSKVIMKKEIIPALLNWTLLHQDPRRFKFSTYTKYFSMKSVEKPTTELIYVERHLFIRHAEDSTAILRSVMGLGCH